MPTNKNYLLDTHIFLWWMSGDENSLGDLTSILEDPKNNIYLSVASVWEMIIKKRLKKLKIPKNIQSGVKSSGFDLLPITLPHVLNIDKLPNLHKDPFDRILIAQSIAENLTLITKDNKIKKYKIKTLTPSGLKK